MPRSYVISLLSLALVTHVGLGRLAAQAEGRRVLGIEVGSKAVKAVLATQNPATKEVTLEPKDELPGTSVVSKSKDGKLDPNSMTAAVEGVKSLFSKLSAALNPEQVHIVISSGVVAQGKESIDELRQQIEDALPRGQAKVTSITWDAEVRYTLLSVARRGSSLGVPEALSDMMIFDIGGGNTKFGYLVRGEGKWVCDPSATAGEGPYGTSALENLVKPDGTILPELEPKMADIQKDMTALTAKVGFKGKKIYLTGGAPYTVAAASYPADVLGKPAKPVVRITQADVTNALTNVKDASDEVARKFSINQRLVAGNILKASLPALTEAYGVSEFYFIPNSQTFWIQEFVREQLNDILVPSVGAAPASPAAAAPMKASPTTPDAQMSELQRRVQQLEEKVRQLEEGSRKPQASSSSLRDGIRQLTAASQMIAAELPKSPAGSSEVAELQSAVKRLTALTGVAIMTLPQTSTDAAPTTRAATNAAAAGETFRLGMTCLEQRQYPQAQEHLRLAVANDAGEPRYWYALAIAELAAGDRAAASSAVENFWNLHDRGMSVTLGDTFLKVQGPTRTAVETLITEVRDQRLRTARSPGK